MNQLSGAFERVAVYLLPVVMAILFTSVVGIFLDDKIVFVELFYRIFQLGSDNQRVIDNLPVECCVGVVIHSLLDIKVASMPPGGFVGIEFDGVIADIVGVRQGERLF